jgi:transcriptional regulator with XRE-family HTH domain
MCAALPEPEPAAGLGDLLRHWRAVRRISQLDLASMAGTTPRYVSFVETGRARPSREMVLRLARALDVPLRERNGLLLAAGFAPLYPVAPLGSAQLGRVEAALTSMLDQHEPYPAVVMDRGWNVLRANRGARLLFGRLLAPDPMPEPANVLRLMIEPGPVRRSVLNWDAVVNALLERAGREAVGGVFDRDTADLVRRLRARPDVAEVLADPVPTTPAVPVIDVRFAVDDEVVELFSVVSTIGTPVDVTAQELRVEAFFPMDGDTRAAWRRISSTVAV